MFFRECVLTADVFFRAPGEVLEKIRNAMRLAKHLPPTTADGAQWSWKDLLNEGDHQRLQNYTRYFKALRRKPR
eukprot:12298713-Alexandrium_andersonii.AAC.1